MSMITQPSVVRAVPGPMDMIAVYADLLPPEVAEARKAKETKKMVSIALVVLVVLLAGWYGFTRWQTSSANSDLDAANASTARLQAKQKSFAQVTQLQAESAQIQTQITSLMGRDVDWNQLWGSIRGATPAGVTISGITGSFTGATHLSSSSITALSNGDIGTINVTGNAASPNTVAAFVDKLNQIAGVDSAQPTGVTSNSGSGYSYTVTIGLSTKAISGRFVPSPSPTAGK